MKIGIFGAIVVHIKKFCVRAVRRGAEPDISPLAHLGYVWLDFVNGAAFDAAE